jgi:hypothetical protein
MVGARDMKREEGGQSAIVGSRLPALLSIGGGLRLSRP